METNYSDIQIKEIFKECIENGLLWIIHFCLGLNVLNHNETV